MSLREVAESNLSFILEDGNRGFGWPITVTDPNGLSGAFIGYSNDIAQSIDPDTGQAVSGRFASATIRISSLIGAGLTLPKGISDSGIKPWIVEFLDINGNAYKFKVQQSDPDRTLGVVVCLLELYK